MEGNTPLNQPSSPVRWQGGGGEAKKVKIEAPPTQAEKVETCLRPNEMVHKPTLAKLRALGHCRDGRDPHGHLTRSHLDRCPTRYRLPLKASPGWFGWPGVKVGMTPSQTLPYGCLHGKPLPTSVRSGTSATQFTTSRTHGSQQTCKTTSKHVMTALCWRYQLNTCSGGGGGPNTRLCNSGRIVAI